MLKLTRLTRQSGRHLLHLNSLRNVEKLSSVSLSHKQFSPASKLFPAKLHFPCYFRDYKTPINRKYSTIQPEITELDPNVYEHVCEETLQSLAEFFEELIESEPKFSKGDVNYSSGVLTIDLADSGIYVINRQSPNKQIWLSSPLSGPKRYDYLLDKDCWIYKHDNVTLHTLLKQEFRQILGKEINLDGCSHFKVNDSLKS